MKLFSLGRTVFAVAPKFGSPVALVKWQKDDDNAAHVRNGMVPGRSPETVYSRIASRVDATLDPRRRDLWINLMWGFWTDKRLR